MKNILITGSNSYIGTSFEKYMSAFSNSYQIDTLDMQDENWAKTDFSKYDSIFHVAGIAHADTGKVSKEQQCLYYKVNTDLTIETAKKAKKDGAKQFIFMSSIIVYGNSGVVSKKKVITKDTKPQPENFYGNSKLQAELGLSKLQSSDFNIVILRPPMIYGKGSKGNYPLLSKFAQKSPVFPNLTNERSMIFVDNLCELVRLIINNNDKGIFYPQNNEYVSTSQMVKEIADAHNKKMHLTKIFNPLLKLGSHINKTVNKVFGNLVYDKSLSLYSENYQVADFSESIIKTEKSK